MYKDLNGDGKIDGGGNKYDDMGDRKILGNNKPSLSIRLDLNADWKGFDFRAFFQGVMKRDYWQGSAYDWGATSLWYSTGFVEHADYFRAEPSKWFADHQSGCLLSAPHLWFRQKSKQTQSGYLQDASLYPSENLQFGYTLPVSLTKKFAVSKLRIFVSGENLWDRNLTNQDIRPWNNRRWRRNNGNAYPLSRTFCGIET